MDGNRGLNPHIAVVARRGAAAGVNAFAPDALFPLVGYPGTDDEGRTMQASRNAADMLEDFVAAVQLMQAHPESTGKVGIVGFCFGGGICNNVAVRVPTLAASAPYYGGAAAAVDVPENQAPVTGHRAGRHRRNHGGQPASGCGPEKGWEDHDGHTLIGGQERIHK